MIVCFFCARVLRGRRSPLRQAPRWSNTRIRGEQRDVHTATGTWQTNVKFHLFVFLHSLKNKKTDQNEHKEINRHWGRSYISAGQFIRRADNWSNRQFWGEAASSWKENQKLMKIEVKSLRGLWVWWEGSVGVGELLRVEIRIFPHSLLDVCLDLRRNRDAARTVTTVGRRDSRVITDLILTDGA